jgi:hypothetical protein
MLKIGQSVTCNAAFNIVRVIIASLITLSLVAAYVFFLAFPSLLSAFLMSDVEIFMLLFPKQYISGLVLTRAATDVPPFQLAQRMIVKVLLFYCLYSLLM